VRLDVEAVGQSRWPALVRAPVARYLIPGLGEALVVVAGEEVLAGEVTSETRAT
jgi:hypothetical protein